MQQNTNININHYDNFNDIQEYIDLVLQKKNILLNSPGGCGKSYILKKLYHYLLHNHPEIIVALTSSTGVSAVNIGAVTLHHYTGIRTGRADVETLVKMIYKDKRVLSRWKTLNYLFIDEVGMIGGSLLDKLDQVGRIIKCNNDIPFGGINLVMSGDNMQLTPINDYWFFQSDLWQQMDITIIRHFTPFRYPDMEWFKMLMRIRVGKIRKSDIKKLKSRMISNLLPSSSQNDNENGEKNNIPSDVIKLYSKNKDVIFENQLQLSKLQTETQSYESFDMILEIDRIRKKDFVIVNEYNKKKYEFYANTINESVPQILDLKVGAECILTFNVDVSQGLANGTRCKILRFVKPSFTDISKIKDAETFMMTGGGVHVQVGSREHYIGVTSFSIEDDYIQYVRYQIPLKIAYAITIHKCLSENSKIYTNKGLKRLKDVEIGDKVNTGMNNVYKPIVNKFYSGQKQIVRIVTNSGYTLECSKDHKIMDKHLEFICASEFNVGDYIPISGQNEDFFDSIVNITYTSEYVDMYDLEIQDIHQFVADGFIVHNCQGMSLPSICTSIGSDIFSAGQAYVALSRCKEFNKLYLLDFNPEKIMIDKDALEFENLISE